MAASHVAEFFNRNHSKADGRFSSGGGGGGKTGFTKMLHGKSGTNLEGKVVAVNHPKGGGVSPGTVGHMVRGRSVKQSYQNANHAAAEGTGQSYKAKKFGGKDAQPGPASARPGKVSVKQDWHNANHAAAEGKAGAYKASKFKGKDKRPGPTRSADPGLKKLGDFMRKNPAYNSYHR